MDCEYVVGEFALDNDISEIPSNWLTTDDDGFLETWWPPSGENIPKLIKERTPPSEDSWETYRIDILAKCGKEKHIMSLLIAFFMTFFYYFFH